MTITETRETQSLRPGFLAAFLCVLTLAALSGTEAGAVGRGALESAVAQYLRVEQLPLANPTDGQVLGYDSATKRAVWQDSSATIGGSLGSTDNVLLRSDGTGGVTAQGSDATLDDAELLDLTATGRLAFGTTANDVRLARTANNTLTVQAGDGTSGRIDFLASPQIVVKDGSAVQQIRATTVGVQLGGGKFSWGNNGTANGTVDLALSRDSAGRVLVENGSGTGAALNVGAGSVSAVALGINDDDNTGLFGTANSSVSTAIGGTTIATVGTVGVTQRSYPEAITGNYTLANAQSLQVFHNTGAGGAITIELGSITATGFSATFVATDNQDITLNPGDSDKFVGLAGGWADGEAMLVDDQNDAVRLVRLSTGDWLVEWTRGTLTEETP